jgi:hypothetical protein
VDGLPCGVPGLAITRATARTDSDVVIGYTITHTRSGLSAGFFPDTDPEAVLAAALELGPLTDWTRPGNEVIADEEAGFRARAIVASYGGILTGHSGDGEDIQ